MLDDDQRNKNIPTIIKNNNRCLRLIICTSLNDITASNRINNQMKSSSLFKIYDEDEDRYLPRPSPLVVLSQSIQAKHPEHRLFPSQSRKPILTRIKYSLVMW